MERRVRIPVRLAPYAQFVSVGLRHLTASDQLHEEPEKEPVKQVRVKLTDLDERTAESLQEALGTSFGRVIREALEHAARSKLNPVPIRDRAA